MHSFAYRCCCCCCCCCSDLQAILLLALAANIALAGGKVLLLGESSKGAWEDFYHNAVVAFGEAWPSDTAPVLEQVGMR
jgi:hypothetical protein